MKDQPTVNVGTPGHCDHGTAVVSPVERRVIRHYSVEFTEAHEPRGIATACMRGCMCCGMALTGMGGPGDYICKDCLDKMRMGVMAEALYLLRREHEANAV